jgi:hypothetical protein
MYSASSALELPHTAPTAVCCIYSHSRDYTKVYAGYQKSLCDRTQV